MRHSLQNRWLRCAGSVALAIILLGLALAIVQGAGNLIRVTVASPPGRTSLDPSLSATGLKIAFSSNSDNLGGVTGTGQREIWMHNVATLQFTRVTTASSDNRSSVNPSLSSDGARIAFQSNSDFKNQGIISDQFEIWLYDTTTLTVTRITTASSSNRDSLDPIVNADGTKIVFWSDSDFYSQGITDNQFEIWLYDTTTLTVTRITTASSSNRDSLDPTINADGTKIAFWSDSDFYSENITDNQSEIWLYDTTKKSLTRITTATPGRDSFDPNLNADGTKIVFRSDADLLGQGIPEGQSELWLYDTNTKSYTRLTTASAPDRTSRDPSLNVDGTLIMFRSDSDFLNEGLPQGKNEIWLYNTLTTRLVRVTSSDNNRSSGSPSLSADGSRVAFESDSDFLNQGIPDKQKEIWLFISPPFLTLEKIASTHFLPQNQNVLTYTIIVANSGVATATNVVITDALDSKMSFASASDGGIHVAGIVTWNVGALAPAQVMTRTLRVTVSKDAIGSQVSNTAWVTSTEGSDDSDTAVTSVGFERIYLPILLKNS